MPEAGAAMNVLGIEFRPFTKTDWYGFAGAGPDAHMGEVGKSIAVYEPRGNDGQSAPTLCIMRADGSSETWTLAHSEPANPMNAWEEAPDTDAACANCGHARSWHANNLSCRHSLKCPCESYVKPESQR